MSEGKDARRGSTGGRGARGALVQVGEIVGERTTVVEVSPIAGLHEIGSRLGAPRLADTVRGTEHQQRHAADLVMQRIREHGADAPRQLHELALTAPDKTLRANLSRAAVELLRADPDFLEHARTFTPRRRPHRR